jgi:cobalt/nickel transport system permease protein
MCVIAFAMHIYEGILATPQGYAVLAGGAAAAAVGTAVGLYKLDPHRIPQAAVLTAAFFVVSSVQISLGVCSEHLTLNGLLGLLLGWAAFPAVLVGLILQSAFVSLGGPTALGLNTLVMALPAVVCHYLFRRAIRSPRESRVFAAGFAAGALGVILGGLLTAASLMLSGEQYRILGLTALVGHLAIAGVEGLVTASVVTLLRKVRPEMLSAELLPPEACDGN